MIRIPISEIREEGEFLSFEWSQKDLLPFILQQDPHPVRLRQPLQVQMELYKQDDGVYVRGRIQGSIELPCHRCLEPVEWLLEEQVGTFLVDRQNAPDKDEVVLSEDDLKCEFFDGEVVDLDRLIAEQIFLSLPSKILCSPGCRGLCPICGANLNVETCHCERPDKGSPFAVLEGLKDRLPNK